MYNNSHLEKVLLAAVKIPGVKKFQWIKKLCVLVIMLPPSLHGPEIIPDSKYSMRLSIVTEM